MGNKGVLNIAIKRGNSRNECVGQIVGTTIDGYAQFIVEQLFRISSVQLSTNSTMYLHIDTKRHTAHISPVRSAISIPQTQLSLALSLLRDKMYPGYVYILKQKKGNKKFWGISNITGYIIVWPETLPVTR